MSKQRTIFLSILFLGLCIAGTAPAMAEDKTDASASTQQLLCNKRSEVMKNLSANYKEAPTALGMASSGGVLEVMTSKDGQTWTVLLTKPDGTSCMVAMGNSWENVKYVAAGPNS